LSDQGAAAPVDSDQTFGTWPHGRPFRFLECPCEQVLIVSSAAQGSD